MDNFVNFVTNNKTFFMIEQNIEMIDDNYKQQFATLFDKIKYKNKSIIDLVEIIRDEPDVELLKCSFTDLDEYIELFESNISEIEKFMSSIVYINFVKQYNIINVMLTTICKYNINYILHDLVFDRNYKYFNSLSIYELNELKSFNDELLNEKMSFLIVNCLEIRKELILLELKQRVVEKSVINWSFVIDNCKNYIDNQKVNRFFDKETLVDIRNIINMVIKTKLNKLVDWQYVKSKSEKNINNLPNIFK